MTVELLDAAGFVGAGVACPDVYFSAEYGCSEVEAGAGEWFSLVGDGGAWQLPFHVREDAFAKDVFSPYGYAGVYAAPSLTPEQRERYWGSAVDVLRDQGVTSLFLRQTPLFPNPFPAPPGIPVVQDHLTVVIDTRDAELAWSSMEGRCRTSIRRAVREGFQATVRLAERSDTYPDSSFRVLYENAMRRRGASGRYFFPDAYYTRLASGLTDDLFVGEVTDVSGRVVAASLFMRSGDLMHYHLSGATIEAGRSGATNLLLWTAMQECAHRGVARLHLGGGIANGDSLFKFKRSFGGAVIQYSAFGVVVDQAAYDAKCSAARAAEGCSDAAPALPAFFPEYRRPS